MPPPLAVDHVVLEVDPREDRSWLQTSPAVVSDGCHALDATGGVPGMQGVQADGISCRPPCHTSSLCIGICA